MERKLKRQIKTVGSVVKIPLENGYHSYARILEILIAFYDIQTKEELEVEEIIKNKVLFVTGVYDWVIKKGYWQKIGKKRPLENYLTELERRPMYTEDEFIGKCIIHYYNGNRKIVERDEVRGIESATIWDYKGIEKRLSDHYAGRFNQDVDNILNGKPFTGMLERSRN